MRAIAPTLSRGQISVILHCFANLPPRHRPYAPLKTSPVTLLARKPPTGLLTIYKREKREESGIAPEVFGGDAFEFIEDTQLIEKRGERSTPAGVPDF